MLVRSLTDDLEIQVRQETYGAINSIAFNTAVAMNVNGDRVGLYDGAPDQLLVNGVATAVESSLDLPGGGRIEVVPAGLVITWPDGSRVVLADGSTSVFVDLVEARAGSVTGLLGNFDGDDANDLTSRDGTLVEAAKADFNNPLYAVFGNSWRVDQSTSLFDDLPGGDVAHYERLDVPSDAATSAGLPPDVRAAAELVCRGLGITDPDVLEGCILDLGTTGDLAFALSAQQADAALTKPAESAGGEEIAVTVTVNGQPAETGGRLAVQAFTQADPAVLVATSFENPGVLVVPAGTYDVLVEYRAAFQQANVNGTIKTWLRDVSVESGSDVSQSVDLELGSATIVVTESDGVAPDLSVLGMTLRSLDDDRVSDLAALRDGSSDLRPPGRVVRGNGRLCRDKPPERRAGGDHHGRGRAVGHREHRSAARPPAGARARRQRFLVPAEQLQVTTVTRSDAPDHAFAQGFGVNPADLIVPGDTLFDVVVTLKGDKQGWVAHRNAQQVAPGQLLTLDVPISEFAPPGVDIDQLAGARDISGSIAADASTIESVC